MFIQTIKNYQKSPNPAIAQLENHIGFLREKWNMDSLIIHGESETYSEEDACCINFSANIDYKGSEIRLYVNQSRIFDEYKEAKALWTTRSIDGIYNYISSNEDTPIAEMLEFFIAVKDSGSCIQSITMLEFFIKDILELYHLVNFLAKANRHLLTNTRSELIP
jgi:hypothetical protein